jgi:hypothetical protein
LSQPTISGDLALNLLFSRQEPRLRMNRLAVRAAASADFP